MHKLLYYILILFFLASCKKEENKIHIPSPPKSISRIDSVASDLNETAQDSIEKKDRADTVIVKSISELWSKYKSSKMDASKYISENNLDSIIYYLNVAAIAATELNREDIASWQLNNIGHYSIIEFKKRTDFDIRLRQSASITNSEERTNHLEETKSLFASQFNILSDAKMYLSKSQLLDSKFKKTKRTEIIKRNIQFIDWVDHFILNRNRKMYD